MQMTKVPTGAVKVLPGNARMHSDKQIDAIGTSFERYGWLVPLLVDENIRLIAGHGRLEAAKRKGIEEVPVIIAENWSETQKQQYALVDNKLAEISEWDDRKLARELSYLKALGVESEVLWIDQEQARQRVSNVSAADITVSADDLNRAQERQDSLGERPDKSTDKTCPECGHVFQVS